MKFQLNNFSKRFFRTRYILIWLIVVFVFYILINNILFSWSSMTTNPSKSDNNKRVVIYREQLDIIKKRIESLEADLDRSNKNAKQLNKLMKNFNQQVPELVEFKPIEPVKTKKENKIAVLVFACNRPNAVEDHLNELLDKRFGSNYDDEFPIIVSQDCNHQPTSDLINRYSVKLFAHLKQPDQSDIVIDQNGKAIPSHLRGYFKIARHYKWALEQIFMKYAFQTVILTEDDLTISVDFFDYFKAMHKILIQDPTLFCVSAWNDNGKSELIDKRAADKVYRSDFFPGLGWMMTRSFWIELRKKWPKGFWDDWLRDSGQRKHRACIRPEVSRTGMSIKSAKNGVSNGQFFDNHLRLIVMNDKPIKWSERDNSFLLKSNYDPKFLIEVYNKTTQIDFDYLIKKLSDKNDSENPSYLLTYDSKEQFIKYANHFQIMDDFKNGVPRTAYKGVVKIFYKSRNIYIAPHTKQNWSNYDPTW